ncbi:putative 2OG-Fe(II) oxygenase [Pseudomonas syringae]|uniref:putative 2OG-Fe(II) oxygenase n=1 Tax=Pseudomonas syringae TaxID=317 RepID=UPI003F85171C
MELKDLFSVPLFCINLSSEVEQNNIANYLCMLRSVDKKNFGYLDGLSNTGWHSSQWTQHTAPTELKWFVESVGKLFDSSFQLLLDRHVWPNTRSVSAIDKDWAIWSTINLRGDFNLKHVHTSMWRDTWSLVYYVSVPEDMNGGEIRFTNPNLADRCSTGTTLGKLGAQTMYAKIKPVSGDLFIFPGWLEHDVLPFSTFGQRIVLAANIGVKNISSHKNLVAKS